MVEMQSFISFTRDLVLAKSGLGVTILRISAAKDDPGGVLSIINKLCLLTILMLVSKLGWLSKLLKKETVELKSCAAVSCDPAAEPGWFAAEVAPDAVEDKLGWADDKVSVTMNVLCGSS